MPVGIAGLHTMGMPIWRRFGIVGLGFYDLVFDCRAALRLAILLRLRGSSSMFGSGTHDGSFAMTTNVIGKGYADVIRIESTFMPRCQKTEATIDFQPPAFQGGVLKITFLSCLVQADIHRHTSQA